MADGHHEAVSTRLPAFRRIVFAVLVVTALITGYLGFRMYLAGNPRFSTSPIDLIYDDLQLFVLGPFPLQQGDGPYPVLLQIGRFAAPIVTVYAFVEAGRLFLANELHRLRTRRARGHVVVCGTGSTAFALTSRLEADGRQVVVVQQDPLDEPRGARNRVRGDARSPDVLRAAGLSRATALYACTEDTAANTVISLAATRVVRDTESRLAVYSEVDDPDLCLALQARHLGLPRPLQLRLGFFNVDELAARRLFVDRQWTYDPAQPPRVLVVGATSFGRAVIAELGRQWRVAAADQVSLPTVTVVDDNATAAVDDLTYRYPFLTDVFTLCPHDGSLADLFGRMTGENRPRWAFICYADEEACMKTALTVDTLWHGGRGSIVVRLDRLAQLREAFDGASGDPLLDEVSGALHLFGVVDAACDPDLIREDLIERLARIIHDRYRVLRQLRGDTETDNPSMVDWEQLSLPLRRSNRAQAEDVGRKLEAIGCALAPRVIRGERHELTDDAIEVLAQMEHGRWMAERVRDGWSHAEYRSETRLEHPDLVPWEQLSDVARDKNRDAVRELAAAIDDAGFRVVKV